LPQLFREHLAAICGKDCFKYLEPVGLGCVWLSSSLNRSSRMYSLCLSRLISCSLRSYVGSQDRKPVLVERSMNVRFLKC
jgi:hypothetical protein